jgi:hypothetical protein
MNLLFLVALIPLLMLLLAPSLSLASSHHNKNVQKIKGAVNKGLDQLNSMVTPTSTTSPTTTTQTPTVTHHTTATYFRTSTGTYDNTIKAGKGGYFSNETGSYLQLNNGTVIQSPAAGLCNIMSPVYRSQFPTQCGSYAPPFIR